MNLKLVHKFCSETGYSEKAVRPAPCDEQHRAARTRRFKPDCPDSFDEYAEYIARRRRSLYED